RCSTMRSRSSITPGGNLMRVTSGVQLAGPRPLHRFACHTALEPGARLGPRNAFAGLEELGVAPVRHRVEFRLAGYELSLLRDRLQDETVRSGAGLFRRLCNASLELCGQTDGGGAHDWLRGSSFRKCTTHVLHVRPCTALECRHPQGARAMRAIAITASTMANRFQRPVFSPKANTPTSEPSTTTPMFMAANTTAGLSGSAWCAHT